MSDKGSIKIWSSASLLIYYSKINQNVQQNLVSIEKHNLIILFFCITGPSLPYGLEYSTMAESPDVRGVLLFGGYSTENLYEKRILELQARADSWNILNVTLQNGRYGHVVIPLT